MYNPFSIDGKTILVTGASSGIGRAIAIECSKMGAKLIITARNKERLKETFDLLEGNNHISIIKDLSDTGQILELINDIPEIDCCANNAGMNKTLPLQFINEQDLDSIFKINILSPILLTQLLIRKKKIRKNGSLVFTSSINGNLCSTIGAAMYSSTKGAITSFMKSAALELASKKIRANCVMPGMIHTNILDAEIITNEQLDIDMKKYPLGRYGYPEEVAHAVIYLFSDAAKWVTGTSLTIDGGYTL